MQRKCVFRSHFVQFIICVSASLVHPAAVQAGDFFSELRGVSVVFTGSGSVAFVSIDVGVGVAGCRRRRCPMVFFSSVGVDSALSGGIPPPGGISSPM